MVQEVSFCPVPLNQSVGPRRLENLGVEFFGLAHEGEGEGGRGGSEGQCRKRVCYY